MEAACGDEEVTINDLYDSKFLTSDSFSLESGTGPAEHPSHVPAEALSISMSWLKRPEPGVVNFEAQPKVLTRTEMTQTARREVLAKLVLLEDKVSGANFVYTYKDRAIALKKLSATALERTTPKGGALFTLLSAFPPPERAGEEGAEKEPEMVGPSDLRRRLLRKLQCKLSSTEMGAAVDLLDETLEQRCMPTPAPVPFPPPSHPLSRALARSFTRAHCASVLARLHACVRAWRELPPPYLPRRQQQRDRYHTRLSGTT